MANIFKPKRSSTASSVPTTSDLADGEIAVNSSDKKIYLRDGQSVVEVANANIVDDTSPQLGGTLDTNGNLIQFGDSGSATDDRLQFGASQDLQIYHDATDDVIHSIGTSLRTRSNIFRANNAANTQVMFRAFSGGAFEAYHAGTKTFETTTSGGTVTGALRVTDASTYTVDVAANGQDGALISTLGSSASLALGTNSTERLRIDSSGRLLKSGQAALTSTSLSHPVQVAASSEANAIAIIGRAADDIGELSFYEADKSTKLGELQYRQDHLNFRHRVGDIRFATGGTTERLRIQSNGQILFSGTSGDNQFTSRRTNSTSSSGDYFFQLNAQNNSSTTVGSLGFHRDTATDDSRFVISTRNTGGSNTERLRIDSSGKIGINNTSPPVRLAIHEGDADCKVLLSSSWSGTQQIIFGGGSANSTGGNNSTAAKIHCQASAPGGAATGELSFYTNSGDSINERLRITSAGSLQVKGDTNPNAVFDRGSANTTNVNFNYNGTLTGQLGAANSEFQISASGSSTPLTFFTNGSERLRIKSDGNVDIGGGTHNRNLTVHAATNSVILIEGASNGTSNLMFGDENDEDVGMLGYNHASNYLAFTVNAEERLRISSNGSVGINTTSDTRQLEIYNSSNAKAK